MSSSRTSQHPSRGCAGARIARPYVLAHGARVLDPLMRLMADTLYGGNTFQARMLLAFATCAFRPHAEPALMSSPQSALDLPTVAKVAESLP